MYERVAALQLRSAAILRAQGRPMAALKAEGFAARMRLLLDAPQVVSLMRGFTRTVYDSTHHQLMLDRALEGGMSLLGADFGNIQVYDPRSRTLGIAAEEGFNREFLEYFAVVDGGSTACGRALTNRAQSVIPDVAADPAFSPHRAIAAASGFRAVQSTPLVDASGRFLGVISTHFRRAHRPTPQAMAVIDWYGEMIAAALSAQHATPRLLYAATAQRHELSADRQDASASLLQRRVETLRNEGSGMEAARLQAQADELQVRALRAAARAQARRRVAAGRRRALP
jgi:GAF domain-containing protein